MTVSIHRRSHPLDGLDPHFLQGVVRQATYQCRADGSGFYLKSPTEKIFSLAATHNLRKIPWDRTLPQRVAATAELLASGTLDGAQWLAAPLIWQEAVRGVLAVFKESACGAFRERDSALLQSLADMTASVAQQAGRLARMTAQFRTLHAIDVALTSSHDPERVLSLILEKAAELVGAEHGSLRQLEPATGKLVLKAHYGEGWTEEALAYTPRIGRGIARWVAEHRRPYLCPDVRKDPRNVVLFEEMRSSIAIPLLGAAEDPKAPEALLGVLLLESARLAAFDRQDVELLEAMAQEAVLAIQNADWLRKISVEHDKRMAAEKWAVMGQAATALAHRINNLLGVVPASAREVLGSLAGIDLPAAERRWLETNLDRIERNARFLLKLSDALFRPFKNQGPPSRLSVNVLLNEALEAADLPAEIELVRRLGKGLPTVDSSPLLLDVFLELITNARNAMVGCRHRRLEISTRALREDAQRWVVADITDSGRGISADQREHLWRLFKPSEEGLGFGLWWIRTFIERQGGAITCSSRESRGTAFSLRLPASTAPSQ
jgi:signal transduction histidine kinase